MHHQCNSRINRPRRGGGRDSGLPTRCASCLLPALMGRLDDRSHTISRLIAALFVCALAAPSLAPTPVCPVAPDPAALPDATALRAMNAFVARLGLRPTGSPPHVRYVGWIRRRLRDVPGVTVNELEFPIDRWSARRTKLVMNVGGRAVRLP